MKTNDVLFLILSFFIIACQTETPTDVAASSSKTEKTTKLKMKKLQKITVTGDFTGHNVENSLSLSYYSPLNRTMVEYAPDPFQHSWDTIVNWFYAEKVIAFLELNTLGDDTLSLSISKGVYCLINLGDLNADGKDEVALVVDNLDYSRVNACIIYTLCQSKWKKLKQFAIHEDAFNYIGEKQPVFTEIEGFLEKKENQWHYQDYAVHGYDSSGKVGWQKLEVTDCQ